MENKYSTLSAVSAATIIISIIMAICFILGIIVTGLLVIGFSMMGAIDYLYEYIFLCGEYNAVNIACLLAYLLFAFGGMCFPTFLIGLGTGYVAKKKQL